MYIFIYIYIYIYLCIHIYACMFIYIHLCVFIYIYVHLPSVYLFLSHSLAHCPFSFDVTDTRRTTRYICSCKFSILLWHTHTLSLSLAQSHFQPWSKSKWRTASHEYLNTLLLFLSLSFSLALSLTLSLYISLPLALCLIPWVTAYAE